MHQNGIVHVCLLTQENKCWCLNTDNLVLGELTLFWFISDQLRKFIANPSYHGGKNFFSPTGQRKKSMSSVKTQECRIVAPHEITPSPWYPGGITSRGLLYFDLLDRKMALPPQIGSGTPIRTATCRIRVEIGVPRSSKAAQ